MRDNGGDQNRDAGGLDQRGEATVVRMGVGGRADTTHMLLDWIWVVRKRAKSRG